MSVFSEVLISVIVAIIGYSFGLIDGKSAAALDCKKLGTFRSGDAVFVCEEKNDHR